MLDSKTPTKKKNEISVEVVDGKILNINLSMDSEKKWLVFLCFCGVEQRKYIKNCYHSNW